MGLTWNAAAFAEFKEFAAEQLLKAAQAFQAEHRRLVGIAYPPASLPGEYLRRRTGEGQASLMIEPNDVAGIVANGLRMRIGYVQPGFPYMRFWERDVTGARRRKSLFDTLAAFSRKWKP